MVHLRGPVEDPLTEQLARFINCALTREAQLPRLKAERKIQCAIGTKLKLLGEQRNKRLPPNNRQLTTASRVEVWRGGLGSA